jgi:CspA family cold shock protein
MPRGSPANSKRPGPPSQLEVVLFWIAGTVVTIASGGVAIYADHYHLSLLRHCTTVRLSRGACSLQRCRASVPKIPHRVQTMRGPNGRYRGQLTKTQRIRVWLRSAQSNRSDVSVRTTDNGGLFRAWISREPWAMQASRSSWRPTMARGTVKWFNSQKGYGFIQPQGGGGRDVFVHISAVEKAGLPSLSEGQTVEYEEVSNRGKTSAENLKVSR